MAQIEMHAARQIDEAKHTVRRAAASPWTTRYARFGYAAKGIVYGIIGGLAAKAALGQGGAHPVSEYGLHEFIGLVYDGLTHHVKLVIN